MNDEAEVVFSELTHETQSVVLILINTRWGDSFVNLIRHFDEDVAVELTRSFVNDYERHGDEFEDIDLTKVEWDSLVKFLHQRED